VKQWWAKLLVVLAVIAVLLTILLAIQTFSSRCELANVRERLRGAGARLDINSVRPPRVPSPSNSAPALMTAIPHLDLASEDPINRNPPRAMRMTGPGKALAILQQPSVVNGPLSNSWEEITSALAHRQHGLDLLKQLPSGTRLDFALDYKQGFNLLLPHLAPLKGCVQMLSAAALVDLHKRESRAAAEKLQALLVLLAAMDDERIVVSELVRYALASYAVPLTWELLQAEEVTDVDLAAVSDAWDRVSFQRPMKNALIMEQAVASVSIEQLRRDPAAAAVMGVAVPASGSTDLLELLNSVKSKAGVLMWRTTWSYEDERRMLELNQILVETVRQIETNGSYHSALARRDHEIKSRGLDREPESWLRLQFDDTMLGIFGESSLGSSLDIMLTADAGRVVSMTAIALRRYHLKHGEFPERIEQLVPAFSPAPPRDPADGKTLRYRRNQDGTFTLYSIGKDFKDDGGSSLRGAKEHHWLKAEDWVWPQRVSDNEAEAFVRTNPNR